MLNLQSPLWSELSHAYGDASDVPAFIERLRVPSDDWDANFDELLAAILHQGDVYTATYAAMPHFLALAVHFGPSHCSDALLESLAYASRGGPGPVVPESLEDAWEDAQIDARDLILERLTSAMVTESYAASLIRGLLYLSGEWDWAEHVERWGWGYSIQTTCSNCGNEQGVLWYNGRTCHALTDHSVHPFDVVPSSQVAIVPDDDFEFDDDEMCGQLLGLAQTTGFHSVEVQMRHLFGRFSCVCGAVVELTPTR